MSHFGMQMTQTFETIEYYTYGLIENYNGRNHSTDLVIYCQSVDELFYSHPSAGNRDQDLYPLMEAVECHKQRLEVIAVAPFSASPLHTSSIH